MDTNLVNIVTQSGIDISTIDLIIALSLSVIIGIVVVLIYRYTHRGLNYERSFLTTLVMVGPIIAIVIMLIGSNLALSLGMVGALSIVRFRTVIKDSRDMIFLFWMIAVGLGCGTYNWTAVVIASFFIGGVILTLYFINYGKSVHSDYVLVVSGSEKKPVKAIEDIIRQFASSFQLRSFDVNEKNWEMVFEIRYFSEELLSEREMINTLTDELGVKKVSLLAPQLALPQ